MRQLFPRGRAHARRRGVAAVLAALALATSSPVMAAPPNADDDPEVITTWNAVAASIIPPNPAAFLNYAFVHLAMYNAVVGITGEYEPYQWSSPAPHNASPEAAAAAAAHRVLVTYFPAAQATLDAQLVASLALVPDGGPQDKGIGYGVRAADRIIALRAGDGRGAAVTVPTGDEAGEWRPTPPAFAGMATPWLGGVRPLAVESLTQFGPGAPPQIGTATYRAELEEVRLLGAVDSATRTADQTLTAQYMAEIPFGPMEAGLRDMVTRHALDISDAARVMAATNTAIADAIGTAWNAKLAYLWWRPFHAIREVNDDGDAATIADPEWTPLLTNPPYPEWPSGLCSVIGAITTSLESTMGQVDIFIPSATKGTRHFTSKASLDETAVNARIWSGLHFRTSDVKGIEIGTNVTNYVLDRYFAPSH